MWNKLKNSSFGARSSISHTTDVVVSPMFKQKISNFSTSLTPILAASTKFFTNPNFVNGNNPRIHNTSQISPIISNTDMKIDRNCTTTMLGTSQKASDKIEFHSLSPEQSESETESDFEEIGDEFCMDMEINCRPRERQMSVTSDDSYIIFDSSSECDQIIYDEEIDLSESSSEDDDDDNSDDEEEESDGESETSVIANKRVRFADDTVLCEVHSMVQWSFAYQAARKGPWEIYARDRERFKRRICNLGKIIEPVLTKDHRNKMYAILHQKNDIN